MKHFILTILLVAVSILALSCGSEPLAEIDIYKALPDSDYDTIIWFSPGDYLNSSFVANFKQHAGLVMPLINQQLGFDPEKITQRYGFPRQDCEHVAIFMGQSLEIAVVHTSMTDEEISTSMNELLGYELTAETYQGYKIYVDKDVSRGYFRGASQIVVSSTDSIKQIIDTGMAGKGQFSHPAMESVSAQQDSIGFYSKMLVPLDTANFATQMAKFEEDQETINHVTAAADSIHTFEGSLKLNDSVGGLVKMHCDSAENAALLQEYFTDKLPEIREKAAEQAESRGKQLQMFITITKESVLGLLDSFVLDREDTRLIVKIELPWSKMAPFFKGSETQ